MQDKEFKKLQRTLKSLLNTYHREAVALEKQLKKIKKPLEKLEDKMLSQDFIEKLSEKEQKNLYGVLMQRKISMLKLLSERLDSLPKVLKLFVSLEKMKSDRTSK